MRNWGKKIIYAFAFVLMLGVSKQAVFAEPVEVNEQNFPDAVFRECLLDAFDYDGDNIIETDDVTGINVWWEPIKSVKGVEKFTHLKSFDVGGLQVTDFDLTKNTELESVQIGDYENKANSIKLDGLDKLTSLIIYSNKISKIDPSKYPKLTTLDLTIKKMDKVDVSKNTELVSLVVISAAKTVDVSKNAKLKYVTFGGSKLEKVILPKDPKIEEYSIWGAKKIKKIDVSKMKNLKWLWISGTSISSIDLSKNAKLKAVELSDSKLKKLDVSKNTKLETIKVNGNKSLSALNIKKNKSLDSLNIGCTGISKLDTSKNTKLEEIAVYKTKISSLNLKKNKKIKRISYYGSKIKKLDLKSFKKLEIRYDDVKRGSTIDLSKFIGTGYKMSNGANVKYDSKTGKIKTSKDKKTYFSEITLSKGKKVYTIKIYYK